MKESGTEGLLRGMETNIYLGWEKDLQLQSWKSSQNQAWIFF